MRHRHQWVTKNDGQGRPAVVCEGCGKYKGRVTRGWDRRDLSLHGALKAFLERPRTRSAEAARRARQIQKGMLSTNGQEGA